MDRLCIEDRANVNTITVRQRAGTAENWETNL